MSPYDVARLVINDVFDAHDLPADKISGFMLSKESESVYLISEIRTVGGDTLLYMIHFTNDNGRIQWGIYDY